MNTVIESFHQRNSPGENELKLLADIRNATNIMQTQLKAHPLIDIGNKHHQMRTLQYF